MSYENLQLVIGGGFVATVAALVLGEGLLRGGFRIPAFPLFGLKVRPWIVVPILCGLAVEWYRDGLEGHRSSVMILDRLNHVGVVEPGLPPVAIKCVNPYNVLAMTRRQ